MNLSGKLISLFQDRRLPGGFCQSSQMNGQTGWVAKALAISSSSGSKSRSSLNRKVKRPSAWPPEIKGIISKVFTPRAEQIEARCLQEMASCGSRIRTTVVGWSKNCGAFC